jgi:hypothetical protein
MKYTIKLKQDTYEGLAEEWKKKKIIPGNENGITENEYDLILKMINSIKRYYIDCFEIKKYELDGSDITCTINISFDIGLDFSDSLFFTESQTSTENIAQYFRNRFKPNSEWIGFSTSDLFDKTQIEMDYNNNSYVILRVMYEYIKYLIKRNGITDGDTNNKSLREYLDKLEDRVNNIRTTVSRSIDELEQAIEGILVELKDSNGGDTFGEYLKNTVYIYYPRLVLDAKIEAIRKNKNEASYKWGLFEKVLAHELFHFFHESCFKIEDLSFYDNDWYLEHMQECLAEYFCRSYMYSDYRVTLGDDYACEELDAEVFQPGSEESDGGYSGSRILSEYINRESVKRVNLKENDDYKGIFEQSLRPDTAKKACDFLVTIWQNGVDEMIEQEIDEEYEEDLEDELTEDNIWIDKKEIDGLPYRQHQNKHWYLMIEEEYAKEYFKTYSDLVSPKGLKTRYLDNGKEKSEPVGEIERNVLEFIGSMIGFLDPIYTDVLNIEMENSSKYLELYWSIHDFMESGSGRDAFNVYFLFIRHILNIEKYEDVKNVIEMLSNYESNAANLVMSHRDHYVHSVYVFLIGLAIYNSNSEVKKIYKEYYAENHDIEKNDIPHITLDEHFMKFWGITSLFHDIGYVYEIPFEQIKSYGAKLGGSEEKIFIAYKQSDYWDNLLKRSIELSEKQLKSLCDYRDSGEIYYSLDDIFLHHIKRRLKNNKERKVDWGHLKYVLKSKAESPEIASSKDGNPVRNTESIYMDHAYFSAKIMFDILLKHTNKDELFAEESIYNYMDSLTAILMHNSLFKFAIKNGNPLMIDEHPLAYILMLCDELQVWNRTSFGVDSKGEMHAMGVGMSFDDNTINCIYWYDKEFEKVKMMDRSKSLSKMQPDKNNKDKFKFLADIEDIVSLNNRSADINVNLIIKEPKFPLYERYQREGLSDGNLLSIYELAKNLWEQAKIHGEAYAIEHISDSHKDIFLSREFGDLSVHVQNSYINRAKALDSYLVKCGYFYTDRKLGMHRMRFDELFSKEEENSIINDELNRLREEMIRYGQASDACSDDGVKKYAAIPSIVSASEVKDAINSITGMGIYRFKD